MGREKKLDKTSSQSPLLAAFFLLLLSFAFHVHASIFADSNRSRSTNTFAASSLEFFRQSRGQTASGKSPRSTPAKLSTVSSRLEDNLLWRSSQDSRRGGKMPCMILRSPPSSRQLPPVRSLQKEISMVPHFWAWARFL
ncbi:hypothetical protein EUTSA_v10002712mg [Eutrema salsugineum]|uniref:Uncharacterized protein n=1 Tax=Eutrema salsugineum TaxID=72664 RepID=V4LCV6_EUTSA|nr:hypothetical protein EUTSA_v10002712mg [Eutrema salsugineum]